MATKIINVQRNDTFDEVFSLFKDAPANEVIFIFPRGSRFGRDNGYFESFKKEAEVTGKLISIMTTDPLVTKLAETYGFSILQSPVRKQRSRVAPSAAPIMPIPADPEPESEPTGPPAPPTAGYPDNYFGQYYEAELAAARKVKATLKEEPPAPSWKMVRDVISSQSNKEELEVADEGDKEDVFVPVRTTPARKPASTPVPVKTETQPDIERLWAEEEKRQSSGGASDSEEKPFKSSSLKWKYMGGGLIVVLIAAVVAAYLTLGTARISVRPQTKDINVTIKMIASTTADKVAADQNLIPGQKFQVAKEVSGTFPTAVEKDVAQKASGKIIISNKDTMPQRLVATTRFQSESGKIFRISQTITVPAGVNKSGVIEPGTLEVTVYADAPGTDFNISASKFTLPGLKDTPKYTLVTAASSEAMKGGFIGKSKVVSEQDIIQAKESLTKKLATEIAEAVKSQLGDFVYIEPLDIAFEQPVSNARVGEAADPLEMTIKGSVTIIAFRRDDVTAVISGYVRKNSNMEPVVSKIDIQYLNPKLDAEGKMLTFDVKVTGKVAASVDKDKILKDIAGMDEPKFRAYFEEDDSIESARVSLSPFWVKNIPDNKDKIDLTIIVE